MTSDKVVMIFAPVTTVHRIVISKLSFTDIDLFDEKVNSILVEL